MRNTPDNYIEYIEHHLFKEATNGILKRRSKSLTIPSFLLIALSACGGGGRDGNPVGTSGDDNLNGTSGDDTIDGQGGDDTIDGGAGNDTLTGGDGDDNLDGGLGDDAYVFEANHGKDTIIDWDDREGTDTIELKDINVEGVTLELKEKGNSGNREMLVITTSGDNTIEILDWNNPDYRIENIKIGETIYDLAGYTFALDTTVNLTDLEIGRDDNNDNDDNSNDNSGNDKGSSNVLNGDAGGNSILGTSGNDVINGDAGNDTLNGWYGDDTLNGGKGDDTLDGRYGDDTYVFKAGHGKDTIQEPLGSHIGDPGIDTIELIDVKEAFLELRTYGGYGSDDKGLFIYTSNDDRILIEHWNFSHARIEYLKIGNITYGLQHPFELFERVSFEELPIVTRSFEIDELPQDEDNLLIATLTPEIPDF